MRASIVSAGISGLDLERISTFIQQHYNTSRERFRFSVAALRGGLQSPAVVRLKIQFSGGGCAATGSVVVKRVTGPEQREVAAYRDLLAGAPFAPKLLGAERIGPREAYLYLEWIRRCREWPWNELRHSALVLEQLARLHELAPAGPLYAALAAWDYESELLESARSTLDLFECKIGRHAPASVRWRRRMLARIVEELPLIRRQLLAAQKHPAILHGDAHSGNAIIQRQGRVCRAVLVDWGRVRLGSPLEDVCSWLQSLGYWEPEARRRHDTLLARYLATRGHGPGISNETRELYWLAGASNAMAGALRYHLSRTTGGNASVREKAMCAVRDWVRIVHCAASCWRN